MTTRHAGRQAGGRRGMTMIEVLMALVIFSIVMAATLKVLNAENKSFTLGTERISMYQNGRFALNEMEKDLRTSGAGAPDMQPQVVYASDSVLMVNANYWTNTAGDVEAVYYNPDAPDSAVMAMKKTSKITIPYTSIQYPDSNYMPGGINSSAETILFYFRADSSTTSSVDYVLYRRVNNLKPEVVATNLKRTTGTPFFQYFRLRSVAGGTETLVAIPADSIPLRHVLPIHLAANDTSTVNSRIDSLRAVKVSFTVSNGRSGSQEQVRALSRLIRLPNVGLANTKSCGDLPIFTDTPTATNGVSGGGDPVVDVTWNRSVDEISGEQDVTRYVIWRRPSTSTDWGDTYATIPATGAANYTFTDGAVTSGVSYYYAVAAQDCTPGLSAQRTTSIITIP